MLNTCIHFQVNCTPITVWGLMVIHHAHLWWSAITHTYFNSTHWEWQFKPLTRFIAVPQSNGVCYCCRVYQHSANNRWIFITGLSQSNQRSVYKNEYVRKASICVLVGITQLVEDPAETDQLTFIKRHRAFESRKLRLLFSFLFIYNSFLYFLYILLLFSFICLFYFL